MDYEKLLEIGGTNGRFQNIVFIGLSFACFNTGVELTTLIFALYVPRFACTATEFGDLKSPSNSSKQDSIVWDSKCIAVTKNGTFPCTKWIFDRTEIGETLVTEFNLICENEDSRQLIFTMYFAGQIISMTINSLGDVIGRRKIILTYCIWETIMNICLALLPGLNVQIVFRFLRALSTGIHVQSLGLLTELTTQKYRGYYLNAFGVFWCLGTIFGSLFAFVGYDWRIIKVISLLPSVSYISYIWIIVESPRWLILKGKHEEAKEVLKKICDWNHLPWQDTCVDVFELEKEPPGQLKDLIFMPNVRTKTIVMTIATLSFCLCYFEMASDPKLFSTDLYLGMFLQGIVEVPTPFIALLLCKFFGRLKPCIVLIYLTVICLMAVPFLSNYGHKSVSIVWSLLGKLFLVTGFSLIDCITSEIMPTSTRAVGMTVVNVVANSGSLLVEYIKRTKYLAFFLPTVTYSIMLSISGVLIFLFIPDMTDCPLPQNLEDAEELHAHKEGDWIEMMKKKSSSNVEMLTRITSENV